MRGILPLAALLAAGILAPSRAQSTATTLWLEDMDLAPASQSYGRPHIRKTIIDKPITLGGRVFDHGVGAHARFTLRVRLSGSPCRFSSIVGVDDETVKLGSVRFKATVDGKLAVDSGVLKGGDAPKAISLNLAGAHELLLVVGDAGDGIAYDHADWADARFDYSGAPPETVAEPREVAVSLTPKPSPKPRVNGPKAFGVRPNAPFLYTIPATGRLPMNYSASGLPKGLKVDAKTGRISGCVAARGTYNATLIARNALGVSKRPFRIVVGDTLALTPPMGWNSWYCFLNRVTDKDVRAAADAMVRTGMIDHGYSYVNIDDCWAIKPNSSDPALSGEPRDAEGRINSNKRFPDMKALTDYIHAKGLKTGIYSSPGPLTCAGFVGSYQHEEQDARRFSDWGFDFLKYDWCSMTQVSGGLELSKLEKPYRQMSAILKRQPRDIVLNLCQYGMGDVWKWGRDVGGNSWRTTGDLGAATSLADSMYAIGLGQNGLEKWAGPGHWNDPDYLLIGTITWEGAMRPTPLTPNEQYTYVSLWAVLAAPMFFSGDMTRLDAFTLSLLTNDEVLDVDLDRLGRQGRRVWKGEDAQVWARFLEDGTRAVALLNTGEAPVKVTARFADFGMRGTQPVRDLWRQRAVGRFNGSYSAVVPRHGVVFVKVGSPAHE
ncbi:MAG TPA: NPCBM/NEW2 domain-containing protein [Armatimonadota bacterium]